jgi:uncharacterized membrane protein YkoI
MTARSWSIHDPNTTLKVEISQKEWHMMKHILVLGAALALAGTTILAQEKKVEMKDLPPAVQKAVDANLNGGTLKGLSTEKEAGKTVYEVETTVNGHTRDLLLDAKGNLIEVEEEVAMDAVPAAVKTALEAHGKIIKVETVTKGKAPATYEGVVEKNGKKSEVAVDASGKKIKG